MAQSSMRRWLHRALPPLGFLVHGRCQTTGGRDGPAYQLLATSAPTLPAHISRIASAANARRTGVEAVRDGSACGFRATVRRPRPLRERARFANIGRKMLALALHRSSVATIPEWRNSHEMDRSRSCSCPGRLHHAGTGRIILSARGGGSEGQALPGTGSAQETDGQGQDVQASRTAAGARGQDAQAPRGQDVQAPRGQNFQAPRGQDVQAPRGQNFQAPRGQDLQAPRGQDVQAPRGQDVQAPGVSKAASLVREAEQACKKGNMKLASEKAKAALAQLNQS